MLDIFTKKLKIIFLIFFFTNFSSPYLKSGWFLFFIFYSLFWLFYILLKDKTMTFPKSPDSSQLLSISDYTVFFLKARVLQKN